jgi:ABC-type phosphate transport system substrate-binding protein
MQRCCILLLLALCLGARCEAKQIAVIVNKDNNVGSLTTADLSKVFKFDKGKWPDGRTIVLVLRDPSTPEMRTAIEKLYHMQPEEFRALLAAHSSAVIVAKTEEELLRIVATTHGAVGLVDVFSITSKVNVVKVDGKLPLEQGYALKGN